MASVIDRAIPTDAEDPEYYVFTCLICRKKVLSHMRRLVKQAQAEHKAETGHDVSFIRGKLIKP